MDHLHILNFFSWPSRAILMIKNGLLISEGTKELKKPI
jgi:hypothetical protein